MASAAAAVSPRLLVVFGLRGTLLERIRADRMPLGMPSAAAATVGMHRVWLRPHTAECFAQLSAAGCDLAIWSSTIARNTQPLVDAVLTSALPPGVAFKFVWSRESTAADDFRRQAATIKEDEHATIKDVALAGRAYPEHAALRRVVLVEDHPGKGRAQAGNLLWVPTCEELAIADESATLRRLARFVVDELVPCDDVRALLPRKIG